jgi:membrane carboxypeptidase/penicillin-binding protein PbpC
VVGAIEVTLLDLVNGYATLARGGVHRPPRLFLDERSTEYRVLASDVCAMLAHILSSHRRRPRSLADRSRAEMPWFMWKTGTSSGRRDALAVGHNHRYAAGVWVGRFGGTGSPHFVGAQTAEPLLTALFDLPTIRRLDAPPAPAPLPVTRPLPPPVELTGPLRILSPAAGAIYVALDEGAIVHPRANRTGGLTWFLNGRLLDPGQANRLVLPPGTHTLRCVDPNGESAAVSFTVRTQPQPAALR